jgi:hypothetical protein
MVRIKKKLIVAKALPGLNTRPAISPGLWGRGTKAEVFSKNLIIQIFTSFYARPSPPVRGGEGGERICN